jgi:hypothetical protein
MMVERTPVQLVCMQHAPEPTGVCKLWQSLLQLPVAL